MYVGIHIKQYSIYAILGFSLTISTHLQALSCINKLRLHAKAIKNNCTFMIGLTGYTQFTGSHVSVKTIMVWNVRGAS